MDRLIPRLAVIILLVSHMPVFAGTLLSESFETGLSTADTWLPEGWELRKSSDLLTFRQTWYVDTPDVLLSICPDGSKCLCMEGNQGYRNEWVLSAPFGSGDDLFLSFRLFFDPVYLFRIDAEHVDYDTYEFIYKEKAVDLEVWLQKPDGSSTQLYSLTDNFRNYTLQDLLDALPPSDMMPVTVSLRDVDVPDGSRVAFRYVGSKGSYMYVDRVEVKNEEPQPLPSAYSHPKSILYWGYDSSATGHLSGTQVAVFPVHVPLCWTASNLTEEISCTWSYIDPTTHGSKVATGNSISLEYYPDNSSDLTRRNNWYEPHIIQFTFPSDQQFLPYNGGVEQFQMGGKAEYLFGSESRVYGLLPFNPYIDETQSLDNQQPVRPTAVANIMYAPDSPLIIDGLWVNLRGYASGSSQFTASVCGVKPNGLPDMDNVFTTSSADFFDVTQDGSTDREGHVTIPFKFDIPAVICSDITERYAIVIEGLTSSEKVLSPVVSKQNLSQHNGYSCLQCEIGENYSIIEPSMFAINMDCCYPWLTAPNNEVTLNSEVSDAIIKLDSYYPAADLLFSMPDGSDLPSWLHVWAEGRYDNARVHISVDETYATEKLEFIVHAPGVSLTVYVNKQLCIHGITPDYQDIEYYSIDGIKVKDIESPGVYIVRRKHGKSEIVLIK